MFFISCSSLRSDILFWAYILGQFTGWWLSLTNEKSPAKAGFFDRLKSRSAEKSSAHPYLFLWTFCRHGSTELA